MAGMGTIQDTTVAGLGNTVWEGTVMVAVANPHQSLHYCSRGDAYLAAQ